MISGTCLKEIDRSYQLTKQAQEFLLRRNICLQVRDGSSRKILCQATLRSYHKITNLVKYTTAYRNAFHRAIAEHLLDLQCLTDHCIADRRRVIIKNNFLIYFCSRCVLFEMQLMDYDPLAKATESTVNGGNTSIKNITQQKNK